MALLNVNKFKGMDTLHTTAKIDDTHQVTLLNMDLTKQGYVQKRTGLKRYGTMVDTGPLRPLIRFKNSSLDYMLVYDWYTGRLDRVDTMTGLNQTTISAAVGVGLQWAAQYAGIVYITSSTPSSYSYDGTTLTALTSKTLGTMNLFFKDREWIINSIANTSSLRYSNIAGSGGVNFDAANHPAANVITVGANDGTFLTAIIVFNDNLYIFKNNSTWILFTDTNSPEDWTLRIVEPTIGCVGRATVKIHENLLYFESARGVYRTDGTTFEEISAPIRNYFRTRVVSATQTYSDYAAIVSNKYILALAGQHTQDPTNIANWVYNIEVGGWTQWVFENTSITLYGMIVVPELAPETLVMGTMTSTSYLFTYGDPDTYIDRTNVDNLYTATVTTKLFDMGEPFAWKRMTQAGIDYNHFDPTLFPVEFTWMYEQNILLGPVDTDVYPSTLPVTSGRSLHPLRPAGWFRSVGLTIQTRSPAPWYVYGVSMDVQEAKDVGKLIN